MTGEATFLALALTAVSIGALHTLAPDHWFPFAALARARGWSRGRTVRLTLLCGAGHVGVSALLGVLGVRLGVELLSGVGARLEAVAAWLIIAFGLTYAAFHLHRRSARRLAERSGDVDRGTRLSAGTLFVLFCLDPCVAVIPLTFAAAPLGAPKAVAVVLLYALATVATMVALVVPAREGLLRLRAKAAERWGDALAGGLIAAAGIAGLLMG